MYRSTFVPETIFRRSIRLEQTGTTYWKIQTYSDERNWARRRIFHELKSQPLVRLMKSSTLAKALDITVVPRERENKAYAKVAYSLLYSEAFFLF